MRIDFDRRTKSLYVIFRYGVDGGRDPLGFVVKPRSQMLFSERNGGYRRATSVGPIYFRTYARGVA